MNYTLIIGLLVIVAISIGSATNYRCVSDCVDMANDGDYQSCHGCDVYVSCVWNVTYDNRKCAGGLKWDDRSKACLTVSTTCPADCVVECVGVADGKYHACNGCSYYVECISGMKFPRKCAENRYWDDEDKDCVVNSKTCQEEKI